MVKYNVRSKQLIDIVGDVKRKKIILSPYFQRNLVWRLVHKQDFVKTILLGYPFPQIFLAKGGMDVEKLTTISLIVDGQQRVNSILDFIGGVFSVDGKYYRDLTDTEREDFLKYEVAIIELELEHTSPDIKEVFKRLNRTFYSLTNIEKLSTEYAPSELMLVAKLLTKQIDVKTTIPENDLDPNVPNTFMKWAAKKNVKNFNSLILESGSFTSYEISRQVPLMSTLNIIGTLIRGFFNRNIPVSLLEEFAEEFDLKDEITDRLNSVAEKIIALKLGSDSYWMNKANLFSLIIVMYNNYDEIVIGKTNRHIVNSLKKFLADLPANYELAAREAVNNKKERIIRDDYLTNVIME